MQNATNIARWLLSRNDLYYKDQSIDYLKLQIMLYYSQAVSFAKYQQPIFTDHIYKWQFGPCVSAVYKEYPRYGVINSYVPPLENFVEQETSVLTYVLAECCYFSSYQLASLVVSEHPYRLTGFNEIIEQRLIHKTYQDFIMQQDNLIRNRIYVNECLEKVKLTSDKSSDEDLFNDPSITKAVVDRLDSTVDDDVCNEAKKVDDIKDVSDKVSFADEDFKCFTFDVALRLLKTNEILSRKVWKDSAVKCITCDKFIKTELSNALQGTSFIIKQSGNHISPYVASSDDLMADDWYRI